MCLGAYYVICTFISPIPFALVEEAVYPPHIGDDSLTERSESFAEKDGVVTHEKEISGGDTSPV